MKLSVQYWNKTLRSLGLKWTNAGKKKRRKHSQASLEFGALEPRKLLAHGGYTPPPLPDPDPTPPPVVVSGPETTEEDPSVVSDQIPDVRVDNINLLETGTIVDGDVSYASPILTGTVEGDFTTYPRLLIQFDLEATGADVIGGLFSSDASLIIENPATDNTFEIDPADPTNPGNSNPFQSTPGWKNIGYRVVPIDAAGDVLVDSEDRMLASPWESIGFKLIDPAEGPVRVVDIDLSSDTDDPGDQQTHDPRIEAVVHGEFAASNSYRLEFEYSHNGQTYTDQVDVLELGTVQYNPLDNNPNLADNEVTVDLTYRLMSSTDGGLTWNQQSTDLYSFDLLPILEASIGEINEETGDSPYRGGDRLVSGFLIDTFEDNSVPYLVDLEIGTPDVNGVVTFHEDGEAVVRYDETEERYEFSHVVVAADSVVEVRARVKQWILGEYRYSPWVVTSVQEPQAFDLAGLEIEEESEREGVDFRGPGLAPKIVGLLEGAPTVEALEDNSETEDPLDYRELSNVRVEVYYSETAPDENSVASDYAKTDSFGHFEIRPDDLSLGTNQIWVRSVLELNNGQRYFGVAQSVTIDVADVELPELAIELVDSDAVEHTDSNTGETYWSTTNPTISGTLTSTDTSLHTYQVAVEYAHDIANVTSDLTLRSYADYDDNTSYFPLLAGHEGEIVKVRARIAYYHTQLGEELYSDWTEISIQLEATTHQSNTIGELTVLGSQETNASDQPIVRGDYARITGSVDFSDNTPTAVTVQFRDSATETVLGQTTSSSSGRFVYSLDNLPAGTQNIEALVLDWNYHISAVEAGPATALAFEVQTLQPVIVEEFEFHSDTGVSGSDNVTSNPTLIGRLSGEGQIAGVQVALTRNDGQETIVRTDSTGRFIHRDDHFADGQTYTYQARLVTWDSSMGGYNYIASSIADVTFQFAAPTGLRAALAAVGLADSSEANLDATNNLVKDLTLRGRVNAEGRLDGIVVEVDFNGDGVVDDRVRTDGYGEFVFRPGSLAAGSTTPQVRVHETSYSPSSWIALPTYDYQPVVQSGPVVASFSQSAGDSPRLIGTVSGDASNVIVDILIDHQGQDIVVGQAEVDDQGNFEYVVSSPQVGESLQFKARARVANSGRWSYGAQLPATFNYQPTTYIDQITLKSDTVTGNSGTATDGVSDDATLQIQVAGAGSATTVALEIQRDGGEVETVDVPVTAGLGEYAQDELGLGYHSVRVRVAGNDDAPWQQINFVYESDSTRDESLALAQELSSLNANWQTADYESSVSTDEDFEYQLSQAQEERDADVDAANEALKQQKLIAEAIYDAAMDAARQDFEANVPESLRRFELDPFTWPDDPAQNLFELPESEQPYEFDFDGIPFDVAGDQLYNQDIHEAVLEFREREKVVQDILKADLEEAKTAWESDLATLKTTRDADLDAARQQRETDINAFTQDNTGFNTIEETLGTAKTVYDSALENNESQYQLTIADLNAGYEAALLALQAEEEGQLPTPRTGSWTSIKSTLEQFSEDFKILHNNHHKLRSEALWKRDTDNATALSVYEKAQSKAQADTNRLHRQLQHEKLVFERGRWLAYQTEVASIQKEYTKAVAVSTQDYRLESVLDQRKFHYSIANATWVRDNASANARLAAVERWDAGLNTHWSAYQLKLAQSQNTYQLAVNSASRQFSVDHATQEASIASLPIKIRRFSITSGALGLTSQADIAETLAVELAQASHDLKIDASAARNQRDQELATVWQKRRDDWSDAEHEFKVSKATADKNLYQKNLATEAEYMTEMVHPSFYGRTWYYATYAAIASPQGFAHRMHEPAVLNQLLSDFNLDKANHQSEYYTEVANAQKTYDEATIVADKTWRIDSSKTYRDALTHEAASESETSGWYSVRDTWKTAVQNAYGKFDVDSTSNQGRQSFWFARNHAAAKAMPVALNNAWKTDVLEALVGGQSADGSATLGGKWLRDLNALAEFRQDVIEDAILAGEVSDARGNRETTRNDDLTNSRQLYFEDLAAAYWARLETRVTASQDYIDSIYSPNGEYVQQATEIANARNAFAEERLEFNHRIALSAQEKIHETAIANELHDFQEIRAERIAERAETIVSAIHTRSIAMIDTNEFVQYSGSVIYEQATDTLGGEHTIVSHDVYLLSPTARDSITDTATLNFNHSVADANKAYEIDLSHARRTLVNDLGTIDLNDAKDVRDINTLHVGTWVDEFNDLTEAIQAAEVGSDQVDGFQIHESNAWAISQIATATANEDYEVSEAEISRDYSIRDAAIERTFQSDWLQESRDLIKAAHESRIAGLELTLTNATAAVVAAPTVINEKAQALAQYQRDTAVEEFELWKNWRTEVERYEAEVNSLNVSLETSLQTAEVQLVNDLRIYANRMLQADGTDVPIPEEIRRDFEIERAKSIGERTIGRISVFGELLLQRTIVQGKHDVEMMTLATARDYDFANAEVDYVETVATAVHAHAYGGDEATLIAGRATAATDRETARQTALDTYDSDASSTKHLNLELLGQKRIAFVADYTQKQVDFTLAMNAIYVDNDADWNTFEAANIARSNAAGTTHTQTTTQAKIEFATLNKQPGITHQNNLKNIRVASTEILAGVNADYHIAIATINYDQANAALGTGTDEELVFAKDEAFAYKAWLNAVRDSYINHRKAIVASSGDLAIDLETAAGLRNVDSETAQAEFERDSQAANNQWKVDADNADATSAVQSTTNYNALDLAQVNADKLLAEELIAAEVTRDNAIDAIKRNSNLTIAEKATQTQQAEDTYDQAVAQAKHDRIIRAAGDGTESGRAIAWNEFQDSETNRIKTYDDSFANADYSFDIAMATSRWLLAKDKADAVADFQYDSWVAQGEKLKRDLMSARNLDLAHFTEIKNVGTANEYYGLVLQGMIEHFARTLEGTGGDFGSTTQLQLIDHMVAAYEALATTVKNQTIAIQGEVADLAQTSAENVALQYKDSAQQRADARQQYWNDHAAVELTYDRSIAQTNLDAALGNITIEEQDEQVESAKDVFELATLFFDEILLNRVSIENLREAKQVVAIEQGLADSVALKEKGLADSIASARYGAGGLARTLAELNFQSAALEADNRIAAIEWLASSTSSPLLGLTGVLSYTSTVNPLDSNATILALVPFIYAKGVAEKTLAVSVANAKKTRDFSVAGAELSLANQTAEIAHNKKVASNRNWADTAIDEALSDYIGWTEATSAELPQEFTLFNDQVIDLSKVDLNLDEAVTSWSALETRWLRTRNGSTWYEGTETSGWRGNDPRVSNFDNLDHFFNRANWYGEIEGFNDDEYIANANPLAAISEQISTLNWSALTEWVSDTSEYILDTAQNVASSITIALYDSVNENLFDILATSGLGSDAAQEMLEGQGSRSDFDRNTLFRYFLEKYPLHKDRLIKFLKAGGQVYFRYHGYDSNYKYSYQPIAQGYPNHGDVILISPGLGVYNAVEALNDELKSVLFDRSSRTYNFYNGVNQIDESIFDSAIEFFGGHNGDFTERALIGGGKFFTTVGVGAGALATAIPTGGQSFTTFGYVYLGGVIIYEADQAQAATRTIWSEEYVDSFGSTLINNGIDSVAGKDSTTGDVAGTVYNFAGVAGVLRGRSLLPGQRVASDDLVIIAKDAKDPRTLQAAQGLATARGQTLITQPSQLLHFTDDAVLTIVGHGNRNGIRVGRFLNADDITDLAISSKADVVELLSCQAGCRSWFGLKPSLAEKIARNLDEVTVVAAKGNVWIPSVKNGKPQVRTLWRKILLPYGEGWVYVRNTK